MKLLRQVLLDGLLMVALGVLSVHAQNYRAGRYPARRLPQPQLPAIRPAQATTNAPAQVSPAPSTFRPPTVVTQIVYRAAPAPPIDPVKAKAAKEETTRRVVEFQKMRAEEGSGSAQYELGVRYMKGDGVEKDETLARKWLTLSVKNGFSEASKKLEALDTETPSKTPDGPDKPALAPAAAAKTEK